MGNAIAATCGMSLCHSQHRTLLEHLWWFQRVTRALQVPTHSTTAPSNSNSTNLYYISYPLQSLSSHLATFSSKHHSNIQTHHCQENPPISEVYVQKRDRGVLQFYSNKGREAMGHTPTGFSLSWGSRELSLL